MTSPDAAFLALNEVEEGGRHQTDPAPQPLCPTQQSLFLRVLRTHFF